MYPTKDLEEAIFAFDPVNPLNTEQELDDFYVDRGGTVRMELSSILRLNDLRKQSPTKFVFTGHKGSGKSTELNQLCRELQDQFFIVRVLMRRRPDVTYVDVLLKTAMSLFRAASEEKIIRRAPAQIVSGVWDNVANFLSKAFYGKAYVTDTLAPAEITTKLNLFGVELEAKFDNEPVSRKEAIKTSETQITDILDNINLLADEVRIRYKKPVLFIYEDTDKLDPAVAKELFYERGQTLTDFRASAIFLMDISLRYSEKFTSLKQNFHDFKTLPNIKLKTRNGEPYPAGKALLSEMIYKRIDASLLDEDARDTIIEGSGGHVRSLISLMRNAALIALARKSPKIEHQDAVRAVNRLRGDFVALLRSDHYPALRLRYDDKQINSDAATQELLERLALLEYANDDVWCDVHPAMVSEVLVRTSKAAAQAEPVPIPATKPDAVFQK